MKKYAARQQDAGKSQQLFQVKPPVLVEVPEQSLDGDHRHTIVSEVQVSGRTMRDFIQQLCRNPR